MCDTNRLSNKIRIHALKMSNSGKSSHIASAFSIADILAVLYGDFLNVDPENPRKSNRDRFIMSKGHAGSAVYAVLAEKGFFPVDKLKTHYQDGSDLSGHISHKGVPGVELSTGSLGHGLSVGSGVALEGRLSGKEHRVVVVLSDGECDEGSTWEAILFAAHHRLCNLIAIIDYNKYQALSTVSETLCLEPFAEKWKDFGWNVLEVCGHNHEDIKKNLKMADCEKEKPTVIIAHTVKGKGVSFMESDPVLWHYRSAQGDEFIAALKELEALS